jgi:predicted membrane-bound spermidine synthase
MTKEVDEMSTPVYDAFPDAQRPSERPQSWSIYTGIFAISMSVLILQIALTRVIAITMWYHFAFLILSLTMLGFGASGSLLALVDVKKQSHTRVARLVALTSIGYAVLTISSFLVSTRIQINAFTLWSNPADLIGLIAIWLLLAIPFFMGGLTIGICLARYSANVGQLYFADLVGAGVGAIIAPSLVGHLGLTSTIMVAALLGLLASLALAPRNATHLRWVSAVLAGTTAILLIGFSGGWHGVPAMQWGIRFAPNKTGARFFNENTHARVIPSAVAQVDVSRSVVMPMVMGGEFGVVDERVAEGRLVTQDGTAPTVLYRDARNLARFPQLDDAQAASGYVVLKAQKKETPDVMVIGVGGGIDVMIALRFNARSVTAVEVNNAMVEMVTRTYAAYIGSLFDDPRVSIVKEDGRAYVRRGAKQYDLIQLSGVDSFTALSTGAYTVSESYLYTVEAIQDLYRALKKNGVVSFSRVIMANDPRETPRLAIMAYRALRLLGIRNPEQHVAILRADMWASTMIKESPFTGEEIAELERFAEQEEFSGLVFNPLDPAADDVAVGRDEAGDRWLRTLFARLLSGSESERTALIDSYQYDLRPATDDWPFFFNYFRLTRFIGSLKNPPNPVEWLDEYSPNVPVGHMILLSSLCIVAVLGVVLIAAPLKLMERQSVTGALKWKTLGYFAALGMGYMFIEIGLMQKLVLFLGHPVLSMSVVLGGMLVYSGLGALWSSRVKRRRVALTIVGVCILVCCLTNAVVLPSILGVFQGGGVASRILVALVLLAPTAVPLGVPFPLGIRMLEEGSPQLIPWAWAVNGILSVLSSVLAVMIAMVSGFSYVILLAGLVYCIGLCLAPVPGSQDAGEQI